MRASAADRARSAALDCGVRRYFLQGLKLGNVTVCEKVSAVPPVGVNV